MDDAINQFWTEAKAATQLDNKVAMLPGLDDLNVAPGAWSFGDNPELADELLQLVLSGRKRATTSWREDYAADGHDLPEVGELSIVLDGEGGPQALIRTTDVAILPFDQVTEEFAAAEGEDDMTLASWRRAHEAVYRRSEAGRGRPFHPEIEVVCEYFELLYPLP